MKLKNKLLVPLFGTIATASVIAPVLTSCGNKEPEKDAGKIKFNLLGTATGVTATASKQSFTKKEAREGFKVSFTISSKTNDHVFALKNIVKNKTVLDKNLYEIHYDEQYGFFGTMFTVVMKPSHSTGDLEFNLLFNYDANQITVDDYETGETSGIEVQASPASIDPSWFGTYNGKLSLQITDGQGRKIQIDHIWILYGNESAEQLFELDAPLHYLVASKPEADAEADFTIFGFMELSSIAAEYKYTTVEIGWHEVTE